jgi:hypothetical protein
LKQMPVAPVAAIVGDGVPGQQPSHDGGDRNFARAQQQMEMIGDQGPGIAGGACLGQHQTKAADEGMAILIITEDLSALYAAGDQMMQGTRGIYTGFAGHGERYQGDLVLES